MEATDDRLRWRLFATVWELLALSFRYPDDELAMAVTTGEWVEAAEELASNLGVGVSFKAIADDAFGENVPSSAGKGLLCRLRGEATRLFVGSPNPVVHPYEGMWASADEGVDPLLFVNPKTRNVQRFFNACGLARSSGANEPVDHVATECELLEYLALQASGVNVGSGAAISFLGGSPGFAYRCFIDEHARVWMPQFSRAVAAEANEPFYRAAAGFMGVVLDVVARGDALLSAEHRGDDSGLACM